MNWFACEFHCHTVHSDGRFTPQTLVKTARERLLDGIALTDHNTMSGVEEAARCAPPVVLPGVELTTFYGHMPVLAPEHWVEWRDLTAADGDLLFKRAHEAKGLAGIAHPYQLGTPICTGGHWDYTVRDGGQVDYIELWSEGQPRRNRANENALRLWYAYLDRGLRPTPTMGRDWHDSRGDPYPAACTYIALPEETLTPDGMCRAIREGRTVLSAGPLFRPVFEDGKTVGDAVSPGRHTLTVSIDCTRNDRVPEQPAVRPREIAIVTNGGTPLSRTAVPDGADTIRIAVDVEAGAWYHAVCTGEIGETPDEWIAMTAAWFGASD